MTVMKKTEQKDDAVSPVVGVMLMLVVTIIIAAVVAAFAGGIATSTETAPVAVLDVDIYNSKYSSSLGAKSPEIIISHISGDSINTGDIELSFSWMNNGEVFNSIYDGSVTVNYTPGYQTPSSERSVDVAALMINNGMGYVWVDGDWDSSNYYYQNSIVKIDNSVGFGTAVLSAGDTMVSTARLLPYPDTGNYKGTIQSEAIFNGTKYSDYSVSITEFPGTSGAGIMEKLPTGTSVQVVITHKPSGQIIYDDEVVVQ